MNLASLSVISLPSVQSLAVVWFMRLATFLLIRWGINTWIPRVLNHYRTTYFPEATAIGHQRLRRWALVLSLTVLIQIVGTMLPIVALPALALMVVALVGVVAADRRFQVIPDRFQIAGAIGALGLLAARIHNHSPWNQVLADALTGVGVALFLYVAGWIYTRVRRRDAMGFGDIKLLAWLGLAFGGDTLLVIFYASLTAALLFLPLWLLRQRRLDATLAFAPYIALGSALHVMTLAVGHAAETWTQLGALVP